MTGPAGGRRVLVVGAGLAGSLLAVMLGRRGSAVEVRERRPDPRKGAAGRGRSINLAISTRGLHALALVGLDRPVVERAVAMRGRMIHPVNGPLQFQPYGTEARHVIHSVSRAELNRLMVESAEAMENVRVTFGSRCVDVDLEGTACVFEDTGGARERVEADWVVGADGAYSAVRLEMMKRERFEYSQSYLGHGYKELTILPDPSGGFRMEPNALHIWPRGGFMTIALPNVDGSFTCTCFWPFTGPHGFDALRTEAEVLDRFRRVFPDAAPLIKDLGPDFLANPVGSLVTVRCAPWSWRGRAALIGDAAHAIVPFYGQGANAGFEDCAVLLECLDARGDDLPRALLDYEARRKEHTDALADLAVANFFEMRDKTGSRVFLWGKKMEKLLHRALPFWFTPLYTLVTFTRTPYADAVRRADRQWRVVRWAAAIAALLAAGGAAALVLAR